MACEFYDAREILGLIRSELYNTDRSSDVVIKELVFVIKLLDERITATISAMSQSQRSI